MTAIEQRPDDAETIAHLGVARSRGEEMALKTIEHLRTGQQLDRPYLFMKGEPHATMHEGFMATINSEVDFRSADLSSGIVTQCGSMALHREALLGFDIDNPGVAPVVGWFYQIVPITEVGQA